MILSRGGERCTCFHLNDGRWGAHERAGGEPQPDSGGGFPQESNVGVLRGGEEGRSGVPGKVCREHKSVAREAVTSGHSLVQELSGRLAGAWSTALRLWLWWVVGIAGRMTLTPSKLEGASKGQDSWKCQRGSWETDGWTQGVEGRRAGALVLAERFSVG